MCIRDRLANRALAAESQLRKQRFTAKTQNPPAIREMCIRDRTMTRPELPPTHKLELSLGTVFCGPFSSQLHS